MRSIALIVSSWSAAKFRRSQLGFVYGTPFAYTANIKLNAALPFSQISPRRHLMELESLRDLYLHELKDLYSAETQLVKALPKMAKAATAKTLKNGFQKHLKETEVHAERLKQILADLGVSPGNKKCEAMEGLISEGDEVIEEDAEPEVRDAALIAAAQRVEHYEIAGYGTARTYAELLGEKQAAKTLQKTLNEEGATDKKLTQLATRINVKAEQPAKKKGRRTKGQKKPLSRRILEAVGAD